ncbi:MAG: T9SS type A sorting domain-containing protein, partial [Sphingobacteriales bacterium]
AFNNFDIFMGPAVAITSATNTFAANEAGPQTQVRSGSWMIPAAAFPAGGTSSWGAVANFTTPYSYAGGNLAIRISHDGNSGGSRAVNAAGTATAGYNTLYKAAWSSGYGSTGGTQGNFAIIQLTYSSPLAVNLVSFEGSTKGEDVQLIWSTASEKNADRFVVQRSQDGSRFDGIDAVSAQAFAEGNKIYEYTDIAAFSKSGSLYYRLQIVDKDGSFKYSRVLKMTKEGLQKGCLTMAPNTVQAATNISFSLSMPATVSYQVLDMNGRSLLQDQVTGSKGNNSLLADFSELPAGNYVLHMNCAEFKDAIRFVKQ